MSKLAMKLTARLFLVGTEVHEFAREDGTTISLVVSPSKQVFFDEKHPDTLDIFAELTLLTANSFGTELDEHSIDGTVQHLQGVDGLVILQDQQGIAGFASGFFAKEGLFYLHGVAIASRAKGHGNARHMVELLWRMSGMENIAFTTQNPV